MGITFSIGDGDTGDERGLLEQRRQSLPATSGSSTRDTSPSGWVLDQGVPGDEDEHGTTWAW